MGCPTLGTVSQASERAWALESSPRHNGSQFWIYSREFWKKPKTLPLAWPHLRDSHSFGPRQWLWSLGTLLAVPLGDCTAQVEMRISVSEAGDPPRHSCVSGPELLRASFWVWGVTCAVMCCNHVDLLPSWLLVIHWDTAVRAILFKQKIGFHSFPTPTSLTSAWGALPCSGSRFAPRPLDLAGPLFREVFPHLSSPHGTPPPHLHLPITSLPH